MKEIHFTDHELVEVRPARELTSRERSVLQRLIGVSAGGEAARCQIGRAMVDAECIEGCGTVQLASGSDDCPLLERPNGLVADGEAPTDDDQRQAVLVFAESGKIRYVETYRTDGRVSSGLPAATELTVLKSLD
jgi:hypothetical protein